MHPILPYSCCLLFFGPMNGAKVVCDSVLRGLRPRFCFAYRFVNKKPHGKVFAGAFEGVVGLAQAGEVVCTGRSEAEHVPLRLEVVFDAKEEFHDVLRMSARRGPRPFRRRDDMPPLAR